MDLSLLEDQKMVAESVRRYAAEMVLPNAYHWDAAASLPAHVIGEVAELGLMGMHVSSDLNGSELDAVTGCIAIEELARCDASLGLTVAIHNAVLVDAVSDDALIAAFALGEKRGAVVDTSGLVIGATSADVLVVCSDETQILTPDADGVTITPAKNLLGLRAAGIGKVAVDGVVYRRQGNEAAKSVAFAAVAVGIGRGALEEARSYALERKQFKKPIADFQAIQWMLADIAMEIDAARLLTHQASSRLAHGDADRLAAQARLMATESAVRASMKAIQIFGGNGFVREFPVERFLRDAKTLATLDGAADRQRSTIAAEVLRS